jgi:hypothetical protein
MGKQILISRFAIKEKNKIDTISVPCDDGMRYGIM